MELLDLVPPPPPPRKGDILFRGDLSDPQNNACLNYMADGKIAYVEGYLRGGRQLAKYVTEHARDQDFLVYPVIFLYRHHIELVLKLIILRTPYVLGRSLTESEKKHLGTHKINFLWQDFKPMLAAMYKVAGWCAPDPEDVAGVDDYINQLLALDPDSYSFRYSHSKTGDPSLPPDLKLINIRHFAEMMERLANYLDAINAATYHIAETKAEMEAEWRSEMASYMDGA